MLVQTAIICHMRTLCTRENYRSGSRVHIHLGETSKKETPHPLQCRTSEGIDPPFGKAIVDSLFDGGNAEKKAALATMGHMFECYEALRSGGDFVGKLTLHGRVFALQFGPFEKHFPET